MLFLFKKTNAPNRCKNRNTRRKKQKRQKRDRTETPGVEKARSSKV
jgi:hypothetical protein